MAASPRSELHDIGEGCRAELESVHRAREKGLTACRSVVRFSSRSIRALHRSERREAARLAGQAERSLREAQRHLAPFPAVAHAGFLHDAEKEYVEARLTAAFVSGGPIRGPAELQVGVPAWLKGLAEAASELRRRLLDEMRQGDPAAAELLLVAMEEAYDLLVTIDYPDAMTGGLRRSTDSLRAVLERSRADVTTATLQARLQRAIEESFGRRSRG